jgi:regulator of cell morphogenesis and NO signaling
MNTELLNTPLAEIVNTNFRASKVLDKYGLDFCCKGKRTLSEACKEKSLPVSDVIDDLQASLSSPQDDNPYTSLSNAQLISHIVEIHHKYVREHGPLIQNYLFKVSTKHGDHFPYMRDVFVLFSKLHSELLHHIKDEEEKVFPLILESSNNPERNNVELKSLITAMEEEHDVAGTLLLNIRRLTNNFEVPQQACNTFRVVLQLLEDFESDLHRHVFKENHVLFSRIAA